MKRVLVSVGDHSGDLILSQIIAALELQFSPKKVEFVGLAGPLSEAKGLKKLASTQDVSVVGIFEVLKKLPQIFKVLNRLNQELDRVDSVLCVDFPDFNLKLAKMAGKKGKPVDYIVAPQVWAWRKKRLPMIQKLLRRLYTALPFELEIFKDAGVDTRYFGHPMRDLLPPLSRRKAREELKLKEDDFAFCLMAGSRSGEIKRHLPIVLSAWEEFLKIRPEASGYKVIWPLAQGWTRDSVLEILHKKDQEKLISCLDSGRWQLAYQSHLVQMACDFAWICSGTASLEAAYFQLPHILFYKLNFFSAKIIDASTGYFSDPDSAAGLPNILLRRKTIPELLQSDLTPRRLAIETHELLRNRSRLEEMKKSLRFIPKLLGEPGATVKIAEDLGNLWQLDT